MYAVKKIGSALLTIFFISLVLFFMFQIIPGSPLLSQLGIEGMENQELVDALIKEFNLDKPVIERYVLWIGGVFQGSLGNSFKYSKPVMDLINSKLLSTLTLALISMVVIVLLGIPLGIYIAKHDQKKRGVGVSIVSQLGLAIPTFWFAIMLMWFFSFKLGIFPTRTVIDWRDPIATILALIMPVISLSIGSIALVMRYLSTSIQEEREKDYVTVSASKGLNDQEIMKKHILRNSLIPVITILSLVLISLLTGSIIIENVFSIDGIGSLLITGIKGKDYPLVQGIILYYSVVVVFMSLALDIVYSFIDPRIRLGKGN